MREPSERAFHSASAEAKLALWERELLDLSLRNALLNLRLSRAVLPVLTPSPMALEDALAAGADFEILPRPEEWSPEAVSHESLRDIAACETLLTRRFKERCLHTVWTPTETARATVELFRQARTSAEENGAGTLYLALGTLRWTEKEKPEDAHYAPVLLLPVEMVRRSSERYVIRLRDDEPQLNVTLLEKLRREYGLEVSGLSPLPRDEKGIHVSAVFQRFREETGELAGWAVLETAVLANFAFSRFAMWNDLKARADDLASSCVVRSLMEGHLCAEPANGKPSEEQALCLPLAADASQLAAIRMAAAGESFVLHGPPGTGKSQTITAIIAGMLARGKTVLFVAEKMAALEVVQHRLDRLGLGPFCLELHSHKAGKKAVLDQLKAASEVKHGRPGASYAASAAQLEAACSELDAYVQALHEVLPCGSSLYELINSYEAVRDAEPLEPPACELLCSADPETRAARRAAVRVLAEAESAADREAVSKLYRVGGTLYTHELRLGLPEMVGRYRDALQEARLALGDYCLVSGRPEITSAAELGKAAALAEELKQWMAFPRAWSEAEDPAALFAAVQALARAESTRATLKAALMPHWSEGFLAQDGSALLAEYGMAKQKTFLAKLLAMEKLKKKLKPFALERKFEDVLEQDLPVLADYQRETKAAVRQRALCGDALEGMLLGEETDWRSLGALAAAASDRLKTVLSCGALDALHRVGGYPEAIPLLERTVAAATEARQSAVPLYTALGLRDADGPGWFDRELELCGDVDAYAGSLRLVMRRNEAEEQAESLGLRPVIHGFRAGMAPDRAERAWEKAELSGLIRIRLEACPLFDEFTGLTFEEKIRKYRSLDETHRELARQVVFCRLAARVPDFSADAAKDSELERLRHAMKTGGRGMSLRTLFDSLPNLLPRLCPCMLMSPISAAQYLDPSREPFDLVVFDEASQLPTAKAVGALARGRSAVIVGDPKQMPPTTFFMTEQEEDTDTADMESILDDCLALGMKQSFLSWHYRSRHESLIAFSNTRFYDSKLTTFPSADTGLSAVSLVPVDGIFERGKARVNRAEAEAVLAELRRLCADAEQRKYSVGVITFNIAQQTLIEDLLAMACRTDCVLDAWAYDRPEPLFIKNLENVQGDERDIILFSVGYGPDRDGKVSMNFGPLNREGGWRRLNVAVTRSRVAMKVFSALRPEAMHVTESTAKGAVALRDFLVYAETGKIPGHTAAREEAPETPVIACCLAEALRQHGYTVDSHVGRSDARVDLAVVDPKDPEKYSLAILLDGTRCTAAGSARDREITEPGVLEGLGWRILRLWTADWMKYPEAVLERALSVLKEEPVRSVPLTPTVPPIRHFTARKEPEVYVPTEVGLSLKEVPGLPSEADSRKIITRMQDILEQEAPMTREMLLRRTVESYGIERFEPKYRKRLEALLPYTTCIFSGQEENPVLWTADLDPVSYTGFRVPGPAEKSRRDAGEVPVEELVNGMVWVLNAEISLSEDDLLRETAKLFGWRRMTEKVESAVRTAFFLAQREGRIRLDVKGRYIPF